MPGKLGLLRIYPTNSEAVGAVADVARVEIMPEVAEPGVAAADPVVAVELPQVVAVK